MSANGYDTEKADDFSPAEEAIFNLYSNESEGKEEADDEAQSYLKFDSPGLQKFYDFYDISNEGSASFEKVEFPQEKLKELQAIFYPEDIKRYQECSLKLHSILQGCMLAKILVLGPPVSAENLIRWKTEAEQLQRELRDLKPCLEKLKDNLQHRLKKDQPFRELLNEWCVAPRMQNKTEPTEQDVQTFEEAPGGPFEDPLGGLFSMFYHPPAKVLGTAPSSSPRSGSPAPK